METLTSLFDTKGCPLDKQKFTWREEVRRAEQHQATMVNRQLSAELNQLIDLAAPEPTRLTITTHDFHLLADLQVMDLMARGDPA